jgi:serine/threonine protein kinase
MEPTLDVAQLAKVAPTSEESESPPRRLGSVTLTLFSTTHTEPLQNPTGHHPKLIESPQNIDFAEYSGNLSDQHTSDHVVQKWSLRQLEQDVRRFLGVALGSTALIDETQDPQVTCEQLRQFFQPSPNLPRVENQDQEPRSWNQPAEGDHHSMNPLESHGAGAQTAECARHLESSSGGSTSSRGSRADETLAAEGTPLEVLRTLLVSVSRFLRRLKIDPTPPSSLKSPSLTSPLTRHMTRSTLRDPVAEEKSAKPTEEETKETNIKSQPAVPVEASRVDAAVQVEPQDLFPFSVPFIGARGSLTRTQQNSPVEETMSKCSGEEPHFSKPRVSLLGASRSPTSRRGSLADTYNELKLAQYLLRKRSQPDIQADQPSNPAWNPNDRAASPIGRLRQPSPPGAMRGGIPRKGGRTRAASGSNPVDGLEDNTALQQDSLPELMPDDPSSVVREPSAKLSPSPEPATPPSTLIEIALPIGAIAVTRSPPPEARQNVDAPMPLENDRASPIVPYATAERSYESNFTPPEATLIFVQPTGLNSFRALPTHGRDAHPITAMGAKAATDLQVDDEGNLLLVNHYTVLDIIGEGSQGRVYLAFDEAEKEFRAIKSVKKPLPGSEAMRQLKLEIEILRSLRHPNIVGLFDVVDDVKHKRLLLVMQYIEKGCIAKFIAGADVDDPECVPIPLNRFGYMAKQILDALCFLHKHGICHRDIKPDNILVGTNDQVYLADFGVAEAYHRDIATGVGSESDSTSMSYESTDRSPKGRTTASQLAVVGAGVAKGTPMFFAPEALLHDPTVTTTVRASRFTMSSASDVWACGVTFYFLIVGRMPFTHSASLSATVGTLPGASRSMPHSTSLYPDLVSPSWESQTAVPSPAQSISMGGSMSQQMQLSFVGQRMPGLTRRITSTKLEFPPVIPPPWARILERMLEVDPMKRCTAAEAAAMVDEISFASP